jgi:hypothetical protein
MTALAPEVKPMYVRSHGATRRRAAVAGRFVLAVALLGTVGPVGAGPPQAGRARANQRPNQPVNNTNPYNAAFGRGRYTPYPVKDPTAAERAVMAARAFRTALDESAQRALTAPRQGGGPPDDAALFSPELAERLGRWSLRWQRARDNAAKRLDDRYQALSDHLARMSSLEDGRLVREAVKRSGVAIERAIEPKPPRLFAEIARFFRPVDEWGTDEVVPELVEAERPLNPRGTDVTARERVEIASRAYRTILDDAVARFLASQRAGAPRGGEGAIFDAVLAERLGSWSDLWRQAQDAAVADPSVRSAAARNRSDRLAWAGIRLADPDWRLATIRSHIERMTALEEGRFLREAVQRAGLPADELVQKSRLREFADVARFFRLEATSQLPEASRPTGKDASASSRAADAGRIYQAIWDKAARRYLSAPRPNGVHPDARLYFDSRLAERLGSWSIRWARAHAGAGEDFAARYAAVRSHIERMASLEDGRSLHDALERGGRGMVGDAALSHSREFAEVARFFRLEALWELERIKSR